MVIYQKQHRLAHRQYCVLLSESRLTRFPPPSKKAFLPASHIFRVNIKCIIKTLFSSKYSGINFKKFVHVGMGGKGTHAELCNKGSWFISDVCKSSRFGTGHLNGSYRCQLTVKKFVLLLVDIVGTAIISLSVWTRLLGTIL